MKANLESAAQLSAYLNTHGVEAILYGSLGASVYLGPFKSFGDIDLLIESPWLSEKWPRLMNIMGDKDFELVDPREHEFQNGQGLSVAFADKSILNRDKITASPKDIVTKYIGDTALTTLSPEAFRRAYEFSKKDGYRHDVRQKNDDTIIQLLSTYIANHQ